MTDDFRSGFVAIVGRPNVGKSTLMNMVIGQKIAIMSKKPQTTRKKIMTVYTEEERGQIVFLDTPGMNKAKNKLGEFMVGEINEGLSDADLILFVTEPSDYIGGAEKAIMEKLRNMDVPVILVLNKIDVFNGEELKNATLMYSEQMEFADIVPVSALKTSNREELIDVIFKNLPKGPMYYDPDTLTDETERNIAVELIREQAIRKLDKEIPHGIAVVIDKMKERPGGDIVDIDAVIICEKDSHKGIIIGKGGAMLKNIGTGARIEIEKMLDKKVNLKLWVKVRKDWRESEAELKSYGYSKHN